MSHDGRFEVDYEDCFDIEDYNYYHPKFDDEGIVEDFWLEEEEEDDG